MKKEMKIGDIVGITSTHNKNHFFYGIVDKFYTLNEGGKGVTIKGLCMGSHSSSQPLSFIDKIIFFDSIKDLQKHLINS